MISKYKPTKVDTPTPKLSKYETANAPKSGKASARFHKRGKEKSPQELKIEREEKQKRQRAFKQLLVFPPCIKFGPPWNREQGSMIYKMRGFKVPTKFEVDPIYGTIGPESTAVIEVKMGPRPPGEDPLEYDHRSRVTYEGGGKSTINHAPISPEEQWSSAQFKPRTKHTHCTYIPLIYLATNQTEEERRRETQMQLSSLPAPAAKIVGKTVRYLESKREQLIKTAAPLPQQPTTTAAVMNNTISDPPQCSVSRTLRPIELEDDTQMVSASKVKPAKLTPASPSVPSKLQPLLQPKPVAPVIVKTENLSLTDSSSNPSGTVTDTESNSEKPPPKPVVNVHIKAGSMFGGGKKEPGKASSKSSTRSPKYASINTDKDGSTSDSDSDKESNNNNNKSP